MASKENLEKIDENNPLFLKPLTKDDNPHGLLDTSSFATLFPAYREKNIIADWPRIEEALKKYGLKGELNVKEGSMSVSTTKQTYDPYIVLKARNFLRLLSRSVPFEKAVKVLDESVTCEIVKIKGLVENRDRFVRRRERLIGANGATLKAIELLTDTFILVQGNTVSIIGPQNGVDKVNEIVQDCMNNVHPVYHIKTMMIKKELEKNPQLKDENWSRFMPRFKPQSKPKQKKIKKEKKEYTPFPNAPTPRKEDIQMETGEYFLTDKQKKTAQNKKVAASVKEKMAKNQQEKDAKFVARSRETVEPEQKKQEFKKTEKKATQPVTASDYIC